MEGLDGGWLKEKEETIDATKLEQQGAAVKSDDKEESVLIEVKPSQNDGYELERLRVSQRVWTQQAVWSHFGATSGNPQSLKELQDSTALLFTEPSVSVFLASVNKFIDDEVRKIITNVKVPVQISNIHSSPTSSSNNRVAPSFRDSASESESEAENSVFELLQSAKCHHTSPPKRTSPPKQKEPVAKFQKNGFEPRRRERWSAKMDSALQAAVSRGASWPAVAREVGHNRTAQKCYLRWKTHLAPSPGHVSKVKNETKMVVKGSSWTDAEIARLSEYARQHGSGERISWVVIGRELGRVPISCFHRWRRVLSEQEQRQNDGSEDDAMGVE